MLFTYTYRSSDGQRHTAEIEAENHDAAFSRIRAEMGVKPIKVTAAGPIEGPGKGAAGKGKRVYAVAAACAVAVAAGIAWWLAGARGARPYQMMTPQGPVTYTVASPLPRQAIPGDRRRIEEAIGSGGAARMPPGGACFRPAEAWLARYAEPGRAAGPAQERPAQHEFAAALREPMRVASTDFTEVVDLKRIVEGMKREMRAYIAGGGTAEEYAAEVEKRQRLEMSYRERAEQKLGEMMSAGRAAASRSREAYDYWLKANASLKAMGIYEIPLPDALRGYQQRLGLDEYE